MSEFKTRLHSVPSGGFLTDRDKDKKPILDVRELGIDFGGLTAVDNFNLMIGRNEIAGLIGPNGAGKTTVFNLLTNVYQPTRGSILIDGMPTAGKKTYQVNRMGVARTFQNIRLFKELSVIDNIKVGLHESMKYNLASSLLRMPNYWKEEKQCTERALELLDIFHMADLANAQAGSLPYGAQRRLEIMRALATSPKLLLLDEPLSNLDAKLRIDMRAELQRLHKELGTTIIYVTHDQTEALTMSTKIALFKAGELNQVATPTELYNNPIDLEAADFIGNPRINLLDGKAEVINGQLVVKSDLGGHTFPAEHLTSEEFPKSGEFDCVLAIRPEQIAISTQPVEGAIPVTIYANQPAGSETITTLKAGTDEFLAKDIGQIRYDLDQKVWAIIDQDKINIYNKETTRLIKRAV